MKFEKEITVEVDATLNELKSILKNKGFEIKEVYDLDDIYMINKRDKKGHDELELLKKCVLIRHIKGQEEQKKLTYKYKEFDSQKEIVKQGKTECSIDSIENAQQLFEALNFEKLIVINDHVLVYSNGIDEIAVQCVNHQHIYIEIEENCHNIKKRYQTIDEMKNVIKQYDIPIKGNNYFVKKAEIELKETLRKKN